MSSGRITCLLALWLVLTPALGGLLGCASKSHEAAPATETMRAAPIEQEVREEVREEEEAPLDEVAKPADDGKEEPSEAPEPELAPAPLMEDAKTAEEASPSAGDAPGDSSLGGKKRKRDTPAAKGSTKPSECAPDDLKCQEKEQEFIRRQVGR